MKKQKKLFILKSNITYDVHYDIDNSLISLLLELSYSYLKMIEWISRKDTKTHIATYLRTQQ